MRLLVVCCFAMLSAAAGFVTPVQAAPITFDFTGIIVHVTLNTTGEQVAEGDTVAGSYTYDLAAAIPGNNFNDNWHDYLFAPLGLFQVNVGALSISRALKAVIVIDDFHPLPNYYLDRLFVSSTYNEVADDWLQFWIDGYTNSPSSFLTTTDLPLTAPDLALANLDDSPIAIHTSSFVADAHFVSLTLRDSHSPVPEPATLALVGLGLAGLAASRRRGAS